jgi:HSP20 family molecular chaperone IbpA
MKATENQIERVSDTKSEPCAVDIFEGANDTLLFADMPGVKREDLEIHIEKDELHVRGKHAFGGEYARAFTLPRGVDAGAVTAQLKDGVLQLKLPKAPELKPKKIDVQVA